MVFFIAAAGVGAYQSIRTSGSLPSIGLDASSDLRDTLAEPIKASQYPEVLGQMWMVVSADPPHRNQMLQAINTLAHSQRDTKTQLEALKMMAQTGQIPGVVYYNDAAAALLSTQRQKIDLAVVREAIAYCEKAIELDPNSAPGYANLGLGLLILQENRRAEESFRKALAIDPSNVQSQQGLSYLESVRTSEGQTQP